MCFEFDPFTGSLVRKKDHAGIKAKEKLIADLKHASYQEELKIDPDFKFPEKAFSGDKIPAILIENEKPEYGSFVFGLIPSWFKGLKEIRGKGGKLERPNYPYTKTGAIKFAKKSTYNARVETIETKPSFRDPWLKGQRCAVPAKWVYERKEAGGKFYWDKNISFRPPKTEYFFIPAIYDFWVDPETKNKIFGLALITGDPPPWIKNQYKPRFPGFLLPKDAFAFIDKKTTPQEATQLIKMPKEDWEVHEIQVIRTPKKKRRKFKFI